MKVTPFGVVVVALSACIAVVLFMTFIPKARSSGLSVKNDAAEQLSCSFECSAAVTWNGTEYDVKISRLSSGTCTMTFTKPDELKNLSFILADSALKVKYGDIEAPLNADALPQTAMFNAVLNALEAASDTKSAGVSGTEKDLTISGSTSAGSYILKLGPGYVPESLSIPDLNLEANFKNFGYIS